MSDDEVVTFLRARLDEDEAAATGAASVAGPAWQFGRDFPTSYLRSARGSILADTLQDGEGQIGPHLARHDPARVLREVVFWQKVLDAYSGSAEGSIVRDAIGFTVTAYASVWSDHPDYRPEWEP